MSIAEIILIAFGLSLDAFAVCVIAGANPIVKGSGAVFRLSFHFGFFQFIMPVIGWLAGRTVVQYIASYDHWVAFLLLAFVGVRMIISGFNTKEQDKPTGNPSRGLTMVILAIATSIDALAVGLSIGILKAPILYPSLIIGVITALVCLIGFHLGKKFNSLLGRKAVIAGGIVLILIGARIVYTHLV